MNYMSTRNSHRFPKKQCGAVLIVSLVILLIMTMLGVSNMRSANMQMKMASNTQSRQQAFHAAELALSLVEIDVVNEGHDLGMLQQADPLVDVGGYGGACAYGRCFAGTFALGDSLPDCQVSSGGAEPFWLRTALWDGATLHRTIEVPSSELPNVKYIVEFMCYIDKSNEADCSIGNEADCAAYFRITSLATSEDGLSRVMLQSTIKVSTDG